MHDHGSKEVIKAEKQIALVGNPNVGKSVIFGQLTGKYVMVSNYPGTTVELSQGVASFDKDIAIIDTPGINTLVPTSEDEKVTRDILLKEDNYAIVQVLDSKNLRRGLVITTQLAEMGVPFILALNMEDEAISRGINIDVKKLEEIFGVPAISTVATQKRGVSKLVDRIGEARASKFDVDFGPDIEEAIEEVSSFLHEERISPRSLAVMLLSGDESLKDWLHSRLPPRDTEEIDKIRLQLQKNYSQPLSYVINRRRMEEVDTILESVESKAAPPTSSFSQKLGEMSMHPRWGVPILLGVLFLVYEFVGVFGAQVLVDLFEVVIFGEYINPFFTSLVSHIPSPFLQDLLVGEFGIITMALTYSVAIILPIVGTFFLAFGVMEDSGYLPRLAVITNRLFQKIGLNGKAVLPMVLGLGCDTMATLTARIMESRRERVIVTLLLALGVPCSAQLGVILGMLGGISIYATALWAGTVLLVLILVGYLASKVIPGEESSFIMDIPPMRMPVLSNIAVKTLARIEWYLREAVPLFILGTLVLFTFDKLELLEGIRNLASPVVVSFLGLPASATDSFIVGFLRRDYGAAGLFSLASQGLLTANQVVVSLVTITLFVPCIANFFIIIKERGLRTALAIVAFIFPFAFLVGGIFHFILEVSGVSL